MTDPKLRVSSRVSRILTSASEHTVRLLQVTAGEGSPSSQDCRHS